LNEAEFCNAVHGYGQDAGAAIRRTGRLVLPLMGATRMMFMYAGGVIARHGVIGHHHRRRWYGLVRVCRLHHTAVQYERERKDQGKQSFSQAHQHAQE
jgi:hypothetical protein